MADKTANVKTVEVTKRPGQGLGLYLREGDGFDRVDGVFVSRLLPGSVTEQSGLLQVGDEILTVNSMEVANRRLEDVVIAMSIPKKLVLTVRTQQGARRPVSETCLALCSEAKPNPIVIIKRGSSVYNDRPRSYCGGVSGRMPRSPERLGVVADSRLLYPRSVSVDFRRLEERSVREEDNFDHLNAVITGDDSGDSGLSSDNSGLSRLTVEPVSEMLQRQTSCANSSPLNVTSNLLILKRTEGLPRAWQQQQMAHSRPAWRKSTGWYGTESESDLVYQRNSPRVLVNSRTPAPSFCDHLKEVPHRKASVPSYQSNCLCQSGKGGYPVSNYYTVRRRIQSEAELSDRNRGSWYSDCDLPETSRTHEQANTKQDRIPSGGYKRSEGDLALWLSKLDRVSVQPRSGGKPSDDIPENCELNGSYENQVCDKMKRVSVVETTGQPAGCSRFSSQAQSCIGHDETSYKLCHRCHTGNLLAPDEDSVSGSNSSESLGPFTTCSAPKLNTSTILRRTCCRSNQDLVDKRRRSLSYDPMDFDCREQRKPLQIRKEAFRVYSQSPLRRKQSCDDPGMDGVLLVHIFCGNGLVSSRGGKRDMCCIAEVDMTSRAQTAISAGTINFDWDEEFAIVLQDAQVVSFVLVSWFERVCQPCFHVSIELKHLVQKERHQRLCLKLEPSGELYVEFFYTSPQNAFPRIPSVHANAVFGADLGSFVKVNGVPLLVLRCVEEVERRGLEQTGIYRRSGSRRHVRMVRQDLERNTEMADLSERFVADINVITCVLKEFLSELPEPLCTSALYDMFFDALVIQVPQDAEGNAQLMLSILDCLPKPYLDTITYLLDHLRHVLLRSSVNKMTITDLSIALGPVMFCPAEQSLGNMKHTRNYNFENHSNLLKYLLQIWMAK